MYTPSPVPTTPDIGQLQRWLREEFERVRQATNEIEDAVVSAYGQIQRSAPVSLSNINATPQVLPLDVASFEPLYVSYDLPNNGLVFDYPGVWRMSVGVTIGHNSSNGGRQFVLEFYDLTNAMVLGSLVAGVGRNVEYTTLGLSFLLDIAEADIGDTIQLRIYSSADTFTSVQLITGIWGVNYVAARGGD